MSVLLLNKDFFSAGLFQTTTEEVKELGGREIHVQTVDFSDSIVRITIHLNVTDELAGLIKAKVEYVIKEILRNHIS